MFLLSSTTRNTSGARLILCRRNLIATRNLLANLIKEHFLLVLKLLQSQKENLCLVGYKLLSRLAPEMETHEIHTVLPNILLLFRSYKLSKKTKLHATQASIIATTYRILLLFLPKLNHFQIISIIPPLSLTLWTNEVDQDRGLALANLIKEVVSRINFSVLSEDLFSEHPQLMLVSCIPTVGEKLLIKKRVLIANKLYFKKQCMLILPQLTP